MRAVREEPHAAWVAEDAPCWIWAADRLGRGRRQLGRVVEYDHYFPARPHPEHYDDAANGRPSHRCCNRDRGNGASRASLGTSTA